MSGFSVKSEAGRLRTVMLHRPGLEMARLTPANKESLLFDEILWPELAQREHDIFAQVLRDRGVEVLYLHELLAESLASDEARGYVLDSACDERRLGHAAGMLLHDFLADESPTELAGHLIGGLTVGEAARDMAVQTSLLLASLDSEDFVLPPLPNHLFARDTSCWVYDGVAVNAMMMPARRNETLNLETIYRFHPRFRDAGVTMWTRGVDRGFASVEGGDVLVIGNGAVLIGMSERTTAQAVEHLARRLFAEHDATRVIALQMPKQRAFMHLDTIMTMVDERSFTKFAGMGTLPSFVLEPGGDGMTFTRHEPDEMHRVIADALGIDELRILTTPQTMTEAVREQWDDGCNLLAVEPGVVVAYERNQRSNEYLREQGIEVLEVPGGELGRGRGGPRCMSCPIVRDAV